MAKKKQGYYHVKLRVNHNDPRFKVKPSILTGIVIAPTPLQAESIALHNTKEELASQDCFSEFISAKKLRVDFFFTSFKD